MLLAMAGLTLDLSLEGGAEELLAPRLAQYLCQGAASLKLRLCADPGFPETFEPLVVRAQGPDRFEVREGGMEGRIGPREAELVARGGVEALWAALRLACALWLLQRGSLLFHGACVEERGLAHAFLGPSGAGKTTLAGRLSARIISDEVTCASASLRVFGHPFRSKLGDGQAPRGGIALGSLSLLSHAPPGEGPRSRLLGKAEAARALLARTFLPVRDAASLQAALRIVGSLAEGLDVHALSLPFDDRAAAFALEERP